jgi:hypothetical protein
MKISIVFCLIVFTVHIAIAQPPKGKAKKGTVYGASVDNTNVVDAAELPVLLAVKDTVSAKIKASVLDVCSAKGCWFTFKVNDSTQAFVKMKDYKFFVPIDLIGKTVVIDGRSFIKTTSVEDQKHYAESRKLSGAKKPQSEIDAITQPKREIRVIANGIRVEG